jgi:hypothetical protein
VWGGTNFGQVPCGVWDVTTDVETYWASLCASPNMILAVVYIVGVQKDSRWKQAIEDVLCMGKQRRLGISSRLAKWSPELGSRNRCRHML